MTTPATRRRRARRPRVRRCLTCHSPEPMWVINHPSGRVAVCVTCGDVVHLDDGTRPELKVVSGL